LAMAGKTTVSEAMFHEPERPFLVPRAQREGELSAALENSTRERSRTSPQQRRLSDRNHADRVRRGPDRLVP
jgi:hypothetical protein